MRTIVERRGRAHLLSVVDFPDDGFPTRPMRGSRGILRYELGFNEDYQIEMLDSWCGPKVTSEHFPPTTNVVIDKLGMISHPHQSFGLPELVTRYCKAFCYLNIK